MALIRLYRGFFKDNEDDILYCASHRFRLILEVSFISGIFMGLLYPFSHLMPTIMIAGLFIPFGLIFFLISLLRVNEMKVDEIKHRDEIRILKEELINMVLDMGDLMHNLGFDEGRIYKKVFIFKLKINETNTILELLQIKQMILDFRSEVGYKKGYKINKTHLSMSKQLSLLGLPENITDFAVIKKQYRSMVKRYHPDINPSPDAEYIIKELNNAYSELEKMYNK